MASATHSPAPSGILLLAAGFSRRFGGVKLAATLPEGETVIARTLKQLRAVHAPLRIVTRPDLHALLLASGARPEELVLCEDAALGMGHTLAAGMRDMPPWRGCLVCLADMPFIRPDTLHSLLQTLQHDRILVPVYKDARGNPVGFGAEWFAALQACSGDAGAREIVRGHPDRIDLLHVDDPGILQDIDTPADLTRHQAS
jgi:molybdenum cofactor cytidylyltransferase